MRRQSIVIALLCMVCTLAQAQQTDSIGRKKVGLVLGGGGAKGAAEVGALKVIEEVGIPIDYIAGTSIGSIIGGLYAVGYRAEALDSMFCTQDWMELFTGSLMGDSIETVFKKMIKMPEFVDFDQLPIPFRCVAVDFDTQEEYILHNGSLSTAMRASMAIPAVFRPVMIDGKRLVDGGMMNNLPVDVVRAMGADVVIAIDLTQTKHKSRNFSLKETAGIGGILDWIVSRPDWKKYNDNCADADIYINPSLKGYDAASFTRQQVMKMMEIGENTARRHLKELQQLKRELEK